jgi:hypothetical protein
MAYLFNKSRLLQSLQLGFAGAWAYDYPSLSRRLAYIQSQCPKLTNSFISPSVIDQSGESRETTKPSPSQRISSDTNHLNLCPFGRNSRTTVDPLHIQIPTKGFVQNAAQRYFRQRLQSTHIRDYCTNWYDAFCDITLFTNVRFTNR